jgi:UDP-N-acetylglucosamine--N-acetylmuramyl-(pentapeptide) pyrophosphoryl-undecaprenol N-acetylglucosamine transferase
MFQILARARQRSRALLKVHRAASQCKQPTILFHPTNRIGLGHISRLSAIALALGRRSQSIRTPFVVEGPSHVLLDVLGLAHLPLPSTYALLESPCWKVWTEAERESVSTAASQAILETINPDIIVMDCFAGPAFISVAVESRVPIVLCLREMKNFTRYVSEMGHLWPHASLILIPHEAGTFELPEPMKSKSCFVGRIVRPISATRDFDRDPDRPRIVVSGGGGGYPGTVDFYNLALKALAEIRRQYPAFEGRLITGPLFKDWLQLNVLDGVRVIPFDPDSIGSFAAADLVICQGGYNTVAELEQLGTKAILVPAKRTADDQFARANRASNQHSHFQTFVGSEPGELAQLAVDLLRRPISLPSSEPLTGATRAAEELCAFLKKSRR